MEQFGANTAQYVGAHPWASRLDRSVNLGHAAHGRRHAPQRLPLPDQRLGRFSGDELPDGAGHGGAARRADARLLPASCRCFGEHPARREDATRSSASRDCRRRWSRGHDRTDAQASVNYWYPRVADTFGSSTSDHFAQHRKYGLRERGREELLAQWQGLVHPMLSRFGLSVPGHASREIGDQASLQ